MIARLQEIEQLAMQLPIHERRLLLERLGRSVIGDQSPSAPQDLYGAWRGLFPETFDVDSALRSIRSGWQRDDAA